MAPATATQDPIPVCFYCLLSACWWGEGIWPPGYGVSDHVTPDIGQQLISRLDSQPG